jgi:putative endonuclease
MLRTLYRYADLLRQQSREQKANPDQAVGARGEDLAHRFLQSAGMVVVARNYRMASGAGEIDLVGWEREILVFVEVKSRRTNEYGAPDRAISPEKQQSVVRAAREYARHAGVPWDRVRFDVVTVVFSTPPALEHFRDAFGGRRGAHQPAG